MKLRKNHYPPDTTGDAPDNGKRCELHPTYRADRCPVCYTEQHHDEIADEIIGRRKNTLRSDLSRVGVPELFADNYMAGKIAPEHRNMVAGYAQMEHEQNPRKTYYFHGNTGTGKSTAAVAFLAELILLRPEGVGFDAQFIHISDVVFGLMRFRNDENLDIFDGLSAKRWLVIDDIGAENITPWSRTQILYLIDRRTRERKLTIITSNLEPSRLTEVDDRRIASRLAEGVIVKFTGRDWRLKR